MFKKIGPLSTAFLLGALLCGILVYRLSAAAGAKLNADLAAAKSANVTIAGDNSALHRDNVALGKSMADAVADSAKLAGSVRQLEGQLALERQWALDQQRIIDGIAGAIAGSGGDIGQRIRALAEGFVRLYGYYHPAGADDRRPGGGNSQAGAGPG
jgi:hypothetical protein